MTKYFCPICQQTIDSGEACVCVQCGDVNSKSRLVMHNSCVRNSGGEIRGSILADLYPSSRVRLIERMRRINYTTYPMTMRTIKMFKSLSDNQLLEEHFAAVCPSCLAKARGDAMSLAERYKLERRFDDAAKLLDGLGMAEEATRIRVSALPAKTDKQPIEREKIIEREIVVKVPCRYCGSLNVITDKKCSSCGAPIN